MNRAEEIERLEALLREARGTVKDLRQASKAAHTARDELLTTLDQAMADKFVQERIEEAVNKGLNEYREQLRDAMDKGVDHCLNEFDKIANMILTGNQQGRGQSLLELLQERERSMHPLITLDDVQDKISKPPPEGT